MKTKLILVDLDLTLLRSDETISQYTIDIFNKCHQQGIMVGFCTSRGTIAVSDYTKLIHPEVLICNAGACIYLNNELIISQTFSKEETNRLLNKAYEIFGSNTEMTLDTIDSLYWNKDLKYANRYLKKALYHNFVDFPEPAMKICVQTDNEEKAKQLASEISGCETQGFSDIPWFKFSPSISSKENAVKALSKYLKLPLEEIISFGDDFADIGMLKTTGVGVAMANAIPQVKEAANAHTLSCDEDGVAVYLEKNILL